MHITRTIETIGFLLLIACSDDAAGTPAATGATQGDNPAPCCTEEGESTNLTRVATPLPDTSIYQLESEWRDQTGALRHLADFRGKIQVVAMIFTTCEYACPRIMVDLRAIEAGLSARDLESTRFLLVSFDSERDTPDVLAAYAAENGLDAARWTLLTGKAGDVREIAAVLGVRYKASPKVGFSHSNLITILGPDGGVQHQQAGLGAVPDATIAKIRELTQAR